MLHDLLDHFYSVGVASSTVIGFIVALAIFQMHKKNGADSHLLPTIFIVLSLGAGTNAILDMLIRSFDLPLRELPNPLNLLVGPLFLLRLRSVNQKHTSLRQQLLHGLPFAVMAMVLGFYLIDTTLGESTGHSRLLERSLRVLSFVAFLQMVLYFHLCRKALARYRSKLEQQCSSLDKVSQDWMVKSFISLIVAFTALTIIYGFNHHLIPIPINKSMALIYAGLVYYLCFVTLTRPMLLGGLAVELSTDLVLEDTEESQQASRGSKYQKSGLGDAELSAMFKQLETLMQNEEPYSDPELNLSSLAALMRCSNQQLSQCINSGARKSFYEYINQYRLSEVQRRLKAPNADCASILAIAFDAGFNSKATFNRYFKTHVGCTPSEYRRSQSIG